MKNLMSDATVKAVGSLSSPVFLAGWDGAPAKLTLHVAHPRDRKALAKEAREALLQIGIDVQCKVREFDHRRIERARSLQDLLPYFAHDGIVFDPTGSVIRANALVCFAERLRGALGRTVAGVYLEAEGRTVYVVLRPQELAADGKIDAARREDAEKRCASVVEAWRREDDGAFALPIRLCLEVPEVPLVPVDRASVPWEAKSTWGKIQAGMLISGITALLSASPRPVRAEGPAVSQTNAKVSAEGGSINGEATGAAEASVTVPVGHSFGVQADAAGGISNDRLLWGVAGQGFWRDPSLGLVGGFASHAALTLPQTDRTVNVNRYGGETEAYLGRFTLSAAGGGINGQVQRGGFFDPGIAWYPSDDLKLSVGGDIKPGASLFLMGGEYQLGVTGLAGLSVFADGGVYEKTGRGDGHYDGYALAGFRFYFGPTKPLIRRHREDDPSSGVAFGGASAAGGIAGGASQSRGY